VIFVEVFGLECAAAVAAGELFAIVLAAAAFSTADATSW
jgi:hypothetical protein